MDGMQHCLGVLSYLRQLLSSESFVDVTLCCLGGSLRAHRVLLSACSPYLQKLLLEHPSSEHTTIILADVHREDMRALLQFMYTGGVAVSRDRLGSFLLTAEALQVKVLKDVSDSYPSSSPDVKVAVAELQQCCPPGFAKPPPRPLGGMCPPACGLLPEHAYEAMMHLPHHLPPHLQVPCQEVFCVFGLYNDHVIKTPDYNCRILFKQGWTG
ncbi:protein tramtrack, beta isoform-like [Thrips palmi]|uniref:Protein tramtrack, beta isoform-like n=1 Tax=Thrips palmi TaxID=161013 RepID=A0A6P8YP47_THRPL|nr:protein tramtrack, beta isoform-like [Thrips palmi]